MDLSGDTKYYDVGNVRVYFFRDEEKKRNYFGLMSGKNMVYHNFVPDKMFEKPEQYFSLIFAFLDEQSRALPAEAPKGVGTTSLREWREEDWGVG